MCVYIYIHTYIGVSFFLFECSARNMSAEAEHADRLIPASAKLYYIICLGSSYFGSKGRDGPLVLGGETARLRGGSEVVGPKGGRSSPWTPSFPPPPR